MRRFALLVFQLVVPSVLLSQTVAPSGDEPSATFKSRIPLVLLDVVVSNNRGQPVRRLKGSDFLVSEDNQRQTIASFEEHHTEPPTETQFPPMPSGVFTNFPLIQKADSVNVLLVDGLNTPLLDQAYVHSQILKYLKTMPPGARVAVFTLTTRLRMLQEFTSDPSALLAAVNAASERTLHHSPLLQEESEKQAQNQLLAVIEENQAGPPTLQDWVHESVNAITALQGMFGEEAAGLTEMRIRITLDSMQDLARYLGSFPGRKNVMWVSGSFPIAFFPRKDLPDPVQFSSAVNFRGQIARTANLLAAARVAIYPIGAQGLTTDTPYEATAVEIGTQRASQLTQNQTDSLSNGIHDRITMHETMDELAVDTGGQAFYDTNGIGDVLNRVTHDSENFYTISYVPTNRIMDGTFRHISVKLATGKNKLSYRRGYYSEAIENTVQRQTADPLLSLVGFGVPDVSQILLKVRVALSKTQDGHEHDSSKADAKTQVTTYDVDFAVSVEDLKLDLMPDGTRQGKFETKLVAYDDYGKPLNTVGNTSSVSLVPEAYATMQRTGLQIHQQFDLPRNVHVHLHIGICDLNTGKIGTVGIRVSNPNTAKNR